MGSGKSYLGRRLADQLKLDFIDLDELIVERAEKSIASIFAEEGEAAFRAMELGCLRSLGDFNNMVVACGGGTPCFFDNMDWMLENGTTVFLDLPIDLLLERLKPEMAHRPLLAEKTEEELVFFLEEKLAERRATYERAEVIFQPQIGKEFGVEDLVHLLASE